MATTAQTEANRKNARHSTGPRTEAGKQASSKNRTTFGLYTIADYVRPEEHDYYNEFRRALTAELAPAAILEEVLAAEIVSATWRLRRCALAEAELGDFDPATDAARRSIERARSAAQLALNRAHSQLRKLQTERLRDNAQHQEDAEAQAEQQFDALMASIMGEKNPTWEELFPEGYPPPANPNPGAAPDSLASNCKAREDAPGNPGHPG